MYSPSLFIHSSISYSRFWIIFTVIILNSLSGRLCISSSFVWSGGFLPYFLTCCIFFRLFILLSLLWSLPCGCSRMDQCLVKASWLKVMCLFWWVELDLVSLKGSAMFSGGFWGVCGFGMAWAACLLTCWVVFMFCWRVGMVYLGIVVCWTLGGFGFSAEMEAFGRALTLLMFPRVCSSLMDQSWAQFSHFRGSGPTPYCNTKTSQATQHR